jgi:uncharacterized protein
MSQPTHGAILTYTGRLVKPLELRVQDIDPIDIAHALSNQCRYTGHVNKYYSVAEHCVLMHDYATDLNTYDVSTDELKWLLLHDATEAYLLDLAAPIKHAINGFGTAFIDAEKRIEKVVAERFDLSWPEPAIVKEIDMGIRANEMRYLMPDHPDTRDRYGSPLPLTIKNWTPTEAKYQYIWRLMDYGIIRRDARGDFYPFSFYQELAGG